MATKLFRIYMDGTVYVWYWSLFYVKREAVKKTLVHRGQTELLRDPQGELENTLEKHHLAAPACPAATLMRMSR